MKEFQALRTSLQEGIEDLTEAPMLMPPNILILKRQTVRQYPGGLMVALYFNEKLNQYFSIPYGVPGVDSTITPSVVKEDHQVGDVVHYRSGGSEHLKKGKVVEIGQGHVKIHRKEPHGGKYGYHYQVPYDAIAHNERMGESVELNEISLQTAKTAYDKRMADAYYNSARSTAAKDHFWSTEFAKRASKSAGKGQHILRMMGKKIERKDAKSRAAVKESAGQLNEISIPKASQAYHARQQQGLDAMNKGHYGAALPHFKKALDTMRHRSKKYEREDKGETVKESVIAEDAISHLQRVRSFKTSQPLNHKDGTKTKVDPTTANALLTVHAALHPDNKQKFADSLEHSQPKFHKMLDFAWKSVK